MTTQRKSAMFMLALVVLIVSAPLGGAFVAVSVVLLGVTIAALAS